MGGTILDEAFTMWMAGGGIKKGFTFGGKRMRYGYSAAIKVRFMFMTYKQQFLTIRFGS